MPSTVNDEDRLWSGRPQDDPALHAAREKRGADCCRQLVAAISLVVALAGARPSPAAANDSWWSYAVTPKDGITQAAIIKESASTLAAANVPAGADIQNTADAIRHFVNSNSVHGIDEEFYSYWHNVPTLMVMLREHARSVSPSAMSRPKPRLECASRSAVMYHLLKAAGIRARFIIVQPDISGAQSHTFLEIYDPKDGSWSIQDPDANVYWRSSDNKRIAVADLITHPVRRNFTPCRTEGACEFDTYTNHIVSYFAMAVVLDPERQDAPLLFNSERIDRRDIFFYTTQNWRYCVVFPGGCNFSVQEVNVMESSGKAPF